MLQALAINSSDTVLEVGTGSGFVTACLATLAQRVTSSEYFEDLSAGAKVNCDALNLDNIDYFVGNIFDQIDSLELYDAIAVTGSVPEYTSTFEQHLKPGGRLFVITGERPVMSATLVTCIDDHLYRRETLFETDIPPLMGATIEKVFSF